MKTALMRKIDYHVGITVCLLFSCLHWFSRLVLRKNRTISDPKKILFVKFFGMGSIILATPAIQRCRQIYPNAELHFLTFKENESLLGLINVTEKMKVLSISTAHVTAFIIDALKVLLKLRRERFDVVVDFEFFSRFTSILSFLSRARCRVGFYNHFIEGLFRGDFLTHKVFYSPYQHTSLAFLDMVETMDKGDLFPYNKIGYKTLPDLKELGIRFAISKDQVNSIREKLDLNGSTGWIMLNPSCSEGFIDLRRWPITHFAALTRTLLDTYANVQVGIIGSKGDVPVARELEQLIGDKRVINFAGRTSLQDLCVLLEGSRCLVTNDTGPAHLAALTDARVITLFGPDTPILFGSLAPKASSMFLGLGCSPCGSIFNGKRTICGDNQCLQRITPEMVYKEVIKEL